MQKKYSHKLQSFTTTFHHFPLDDENLTHVVGIAAYAQRLAETPRHTPLALIPYPYLACLPWCHRFPGVVRHRASTF